MTPIRSLLFIGSMQTPEDCAANRWCSEAMNVTQLELMRVFEHCGVERIMALSFPGTSSRYSPQRLMKLRKTTLSPSTTLVELPFVALGPLQIVSQSLALWWALARLDSRYEAVIITNPHIRLYVPALFWSKLRRMVVIILASDLSPYVTAHNPLRRLQQWSEIMVARLAPGIAVFSSHLGRDLRGARPWIRIARPPAPDVMSRRDEMLPAETIHTIYFAGTTAEVSGTDLLLAAIRQIGSPNYRFWFSGRGPLDDAIREAAQNDNRITHWGFVSREQYLNLLQNANVLINPRPSRLPENRYNFPSKLMEYMAAGRPIISTATSDVREYYRDAIVLLEDETPQGLAKAIVETCELPFEEQMALGQCARQHVEQETWEAQAQRILDFVESLSR
ncbi:MAG: glycosyltransferase [Aggregatilineales bacterium]